MNRTKTCRHSLLVATHLSVLLCSSALCAVEFRTIDGTENNLANPLQGAADTQLVRMRDVLVNPRVGFQPALLAPDYEDGIDAPRGMIDMNPPGMGTTRLPNPRDISNAVAAQGSRSIENPLRASDWLWQWGQFIDHDFALEEATPTAPLMISITDPSDPLFNSAFPFIPFRRTSAAPGTGAGTSVAREQVNRITAYIDGSSVYGSDAERAAYLRTFSGGQLKTTSAVNGEIILPMNRAVDPLPNANPPLVPGATPPSPEELFVAGDVRANEQIGLTAVHTLFVREHNRIAAELGGRSDLAALVTDAGGDPNLPADVDQYLYHMSRKAVAAQIQAITYEEFVPMLVGSSAMPAYTGYDPSVNAAVSNEFATVGFRVGHTLLSPEIQLVSPSGDSLGSVALSASFFDPTFVQEYGVDAILMGLASQKSQDVDALVIDDVRNFLFADGNGGIDLAAVNIQRGRDHGMPSYNALRVGLGLTPRTSFDEITQNAEVAAGLAEVYTSIDDVDAWIGAIAEDPIADGLTGELLTEILVDQFARLRDGDRFYYLNDDDVLGLFPDVGATRLADVVLRNSAMTKMPGSAFRVVPEPATFLLGALMVATLASRRENRRRPLKA